MTKKLSESNEKLLSAAEKGDLDAVKAALEAGADINANDSAHMSPLLKAACSEHKEVVDYLLEKGAVVKQSDLGVMQLRMNVYDEGVENGMLNAGPAGIMKNLFQYFLNTFAKAYLKQNKK